MCHALKCLPHQGGLYDQDAEFVEWYYKFIGFLAQAGNQPVPENGDGNLNGAQDAVAQALLGQVQ